MDLSLMKRIGEALELDSCNKYQEAYVKYIECILSVANNLLHKVTVLGGNSTTTREALRYVQLGQQSFDRVAALLKIIYDNSAPIQKLSDPVPPLQDEASVHQFALDKKKTLSPMEVAYKQNQQLKTAYRARMSRIKTRDSTTASLSLTIQRKMAENLAIAKAQEEALSKKMKERQLRLEEQAARRFTAPIGMSDEEQEQRQIYKKILEYEQEAKWLAEWRDKLNRNPMDTILINQLIQEILRCTDHPLTLLLKNYQFKVYEKLYPLVSRKTDTVHDIVVPLPEYLHPAHTKQKISQEPRNTNTESMLKETDIQDKTVIQSADENISPSENNNILPKKKPFSCDGTENEFQYENEERTVCISASKISSQDLSDENCRVEFSDKCDVHVETVQCYSERKEDLSGHSQTEKSKCNEQEDADHGKTEKSKCNEQEDADHGKTEMSKCNEQEDADHGKTAKYKCYELSDDSNPEETEKYKWKQLKDANLDKDGEESKRKKLQNTDSGETGDESKCNEQEKADPGETDVSKWKQLKDANPDKDGEQSKRKKLQNTKLKKLEDIDSSEESDLMKSESNLANIFDTSQQTHKDLQLALEKGKTLKRQLTSEIEKSNSCVLNFSKDYEKYNQENMDDLFDDDDQSSGCDQDGSNDDDDGDDGDDTIRDSDRLKHDKGDIPQTVLTSTNESQSIRQSENNRFSLPSSSKSLDPLPASTKLPHSHTTPDISDSQLCQMSEEAHHRHLKSISEDVHSYMEKLLVMFTIAYENLDSPTGRDQCYATLEEAFFKSLWKYLLTLYRFANKSKETMLAYHMTVQQDWGPSRFGVIDKLCLKSEDVGEHIPYESAIEELCRVKEHYTMLSKLECIVRVCRLVMICVEEYYTANQHTTKKSPNIGADDLLPILSYIVIKSCLPQLVSECSAMSEFIHEGYIMGEEGYCLTSLQTAILHCCIDQ